MALFGRKKEEKKEEKKEKKKPEPKLVPYYRRPLRAPIETRPRITTREYRLFKEAEKRPLGWYERLAKLAGGILKVSPGKDARAEIQSAISFANLRITPDDVMSLFVSSALVFAVIGLILALSGFIPLIGGVLVIALGMVIGYYLYRYPVNLLKELRIKASSQVVLAILYMVVSMRISPNLERALRFAATNVTGALAWDLRRLLWDIQMRKYPSGWEAMEAYIVKWKPENEEFAEALRLIRDSTTQMPERAKAILDEALNIVLEGTKTRMKHYAQELKMPVMIIHMMGIILPVLGTIMAPLVAVFMADLARPEYFIVGYNIALPIVIVWFINNTLRKRPVTFSAVGIAKHPDLPKKGAFLRGGRSIPVWPIALAVLLAFLVPSFLYFIGNPDILLGGTTGREISIFSLVMSSLIIVGIGMSLAVYFFLANYQRLKIQNDIQKIEGEFELALFQLGNRIAGGIPTEVAIEKSIDDVKDLKIVDLFKRTLNNIRNLGMTFEGALFDPQYGSLKYYPSQLIRNIMNAVVDTARKGVKYASEGMLRIARYLKNIRDTQEYIRDILEETTSSMKFQAYFLTPLITGLIVSMADVIMMVLAQLGAYLEGMGVGETMGLGNFALAFGFSEASISPELFQLIIGVYLLEVLVILGMFLTKISRGEDRTHQWYSTSKILVIGVVLYLLVALTASTLFGDMIKEALSGLGVLG
ncbi:MAG: hypothetical protein ACE5FW_00280 [Candidatus Aenigmatarchaeota archaeon]